MVVAQTQRLSHPGSRLTYFKSIDISRDSVTIVLVLLSVLDLCGDETSKTRQNKPLVTGTPIAQDLQSMRQMMRMTKIHRLKPKPKLVLTYGSPLASAVALRLGGVDAFDVIMFRNRSGLGESVRRLFRAWAAKN